ncbi:hypothetical protein LSH36_614g02029 [Paralvinella palmiformis]|uniref:IC97/Casc1 N-terminal domain-containing protein n=1 Tax=Paralvinella palmiformis TaxID=53620 RepID=A0AAD9J637_9ANNE|nr:hypothetical protein LSH36_614g02029 [Paralvinella palmiformis]
MLCGRSEPPKSASKKLSKGEKEKLKKEEAEQKLREEEEARLQAEREEAARKEKEKEEAEERRRLENEERKKRKGQLDELESLWQSHYNTLLEEQAEKRRKDRLIGELTGIMETTPDDELTDKMKSQYKQTLRDLQELLQEKLDLASHDVFLKATELQNSETLNLQEIVTKGDITLCVWGNLSKNPRIKSHEFEGTGFTFEIPRILTLTDCGVRVLFTKYDHFSEHSISYEPRYKQPVSVAPPEEPKEEEPEEGKEKEEEEKQNEEDGVSREETQDVMAALNALEEEAAEEEENKDEEQKEEDDEPLEEDFEVKTPEPEEFDDFDGDEDAIDLRANHVLGGVFFFNLINLPPQPRNVENWVITQVVEPPALSYIEYVADTAPTSQTPDAKKMDEHKEKEKPPIGVTVRLPEQVYFSEEPQIVRWDYDQKVWTLDGFSDHKFDEEKRILSFKTAYFGAMSLIQDSHSNMPFQSWEIRPRGTNHAQMTIIAAVVEVDIQIKDDLCCLSAPDDKPELQHLINQWYPVHTLIKKMKAAGLNLFPACDSAKFVNIQNKNPITEEHMYQQMSLVSSSVAFSWSKWNADVSEPKKEKIIIQTAEHLVDEPLMEEDWSLWLVTKKRTTKLRMTEFDENFSEDHAEGTEFNADMYHMAMELVSDDAKERIRNTSHKFVYGVYTMLKSTKILTYS